MAEIWVDRKAGTLKSSPKNVAIYSKNTVKLTWKWSAKGQVDPLGWNFGCSEGWDPQKQPKKRCDF